MPGPKLDPTVNITNVISVLVLLGGLATAWTTLSTKIAVMEDRQARMQGSITELSTRTAKTEDYILAHNPDFLQMVTKSRPMFAPASMGHTVGATGEAFGQSVAADAPARK